MTGLALAVVALTNAWGSIAVDPVGATLVSYIPAGGREVLFRSAVKADADPRHVCFNGGAEVFRACGRFAMKANGTCALRGDLV